MMRTLLSTKLKLLALVFCGISTAFAAEPSYTLYNYNQDHFLVYKNVETVRPIASITKLMTAIVVIESGVDLKEKIDAGKSRLHPKASRLDLLYSLLISSDNGAAENLANAHPNGREAFIKDMNATAARYRLTNTTYEDPSGLGEGNQSTILDLIKILKIANEKDIIRSITTKTEHKFVLPFHKRTKEVIIHNTNRTSLFAYDNIVLTKTGFTNPAGRCVAMLVEKDKELYAVIILGEPTIEQRWTEIKSLMDHFKKNEIHIYGNDRH